MGKFKEFIVYDTETDLPLVMGSADECADFLGTTKKNFYAMKSTPERFKAKIEIFDLAELLEDCEKGVDNL